MGYVTAFMWLAVFAVSIVTGIMLPDTPIEFIHITGVSDSVLLLAKSAALMTAAGALIGAARAVIGD